MLPAAWSSGVHVHLWVDSDKPAAAARCKACDSHTISLLSKTAITLHTCTPSAHATAQGKIRNEVVQEARRYLACCPEYILFCLWLFVKAVDRGTLCQTLTVLIASERCSALSIRLLLPCAALTATQKCLGSLALCVGMTVVWRQLLFSHGP